MKKQSKDSNIVYDVDNEANNELDILNSKLIRNSNNDMRILMFYFGL